MTANGCIIAGRSKAIRWFVTYSPDCAGGWPETIGWMANAAGATKSAAAESVEEKRTESQCKHEWTRMNTNGVRSRLSAGASAKEDVAAESAIDAMTITEMKTNEFISVLRAAPGKQLIFVDLNGHAVHRGYHLTELKAASFETVDCGGQTNRWQETIVQLWVPPDPTNDYMTAAKFLKIFDKARRMIPLNLDAEIRVEYGDENPFPSTYHVCSVTRNENATRVLLEPPATTCKARDRRAGRAQATDSSCAAKTQSCCAA